MTAWKTGGQVAVSIVAAVLLYFLPFGPTLYEIVRSDLTDAAIEEDWSEDEEEDYDPDWVDVPMGDMSDIPPSPPVPEPPPPPPPPDPPRAHPLPNAIPVEVPPEPPVTPVEPEPVVAEVDPPDTDVPEDTVDTDEPQDDTDDPQVQKYIEKRGPKALRPTARKPADPGKTQKKPKKPKKPGKPLPPCAPPSEFIARLEDKHWEIKRDLVEYYTSHPFQFDDLAGVWTHKNKETGKNDGFKIGLPRCSVLRQAGFRSGDVINDVNGRTISTIPQAIGAYFAMQRRETFIVNITRKGESMTLTYEVPHKEKKHRRKKQKEGDDDDDVADTKPGQ